MIALNNYSYITVDSVRFVAQANHIKQTLELFAFEPLAIDSLYLEGPRIGAVCAHCLENQCVWRKGALILFHLDLSWTTMVYGHCLTYLRWFALACLSRRWPSPRPFSTYVYAKFSLLCKRLTCQQPLLLNNWFKADWESYIHVKRVCALLSKL